MKSGDISDYGIHKRSAGGTPVERAVEALRLAGYAVMPGGYDPAMLARISQAFDTVADAAQAAHGGREALAKIGERGTVRAPLAWDRLFLDLAQNPGVLEICRALVGDYLVLNQQNGVSNPPSGENYSQGAYHRDLPYQHFTSSRPLAISALFCLDPFTADTGATWVLPGSHKVEEFPSQETATALQVQICAPAGSFILLDSMVYHRGGVNASPRPRRGVNHVYGIPLLRQQIDLPRLLGADYTKDAGLRKLLGYDVQTPDSIDAWYQTRRSRS